jgi:C1A family cysteine protease
MEMGRFADLSEEEFVKTQLKYRPSRGKVKMVTREILRDPTAAFAKNEARLGSRDDENYDDLPAQFSWTEPQPGFGDVVGEVHNQQDICASCWAFVSADSIAGRWAVATKTDVVPMSVKQLMVCDHQDNGCNTGNMYTAYDWIGENGGLSTQEAYDARVPGETQDDERATCDASVPLEITTPGMCDLKMTAGNRALMIAIKEAGPVAIGINANNLQFYESGIIDAASCPPAGRGIQSINHAALVVGWGEEGGTKYWLVKNSYGEEFGEHGYFKLERMRPNEENLFGTCGLLFESVYPVVAKAGEEVDGAAQCTEGSVFKKDYYRNEEDNPGAAAYASAGALAEADAAVAAAASAALGTNIRTAELGEARWGTKHAKPAVAAGAGVAATAAVAAVAAVVATRARRSRAAGEREALLP